MFIQTEATPDPKTLKFLPGREVLAQGPVELRDEGQAANSPLGQRLFAIPGVARLTFGSDYIDITQKDGDWHHLKPMILGAIMEHFMTGAPVFNPKRELESSKSGIVQTEAVGRIREALRRVIDPELGYNIVDLGLVYDVSSEEGGVVRITMTTTTPGCPATNYLKGGASQAAGELPGVEFVEVDLTYEPRWTPEMMSPGAKAHLGIG